MSHNPYLPPVAHPIDPSPQRSILRMLVPTLTLLASIALFIASLTQDCFLIDRADNPRAWSLGFGLLLVGWLGLSDTPAWIANPLLFMGWLLIWFPGAKAIPLVVTLAALGFALSFLGCEEITSNAAGGKNKITAYGLGYWLWVSSCGVAVLGSLSAYFVNRRGT